MNNSEGWTVTRQDLTGHDPTEPLPYPTKKWWFGTEKEAEAWAAKVRDHFAGDENQLVRVRPCEGFSLVIHSLSNPEAKPQYRTYAIRAEARQQLVYRLMQPNFLTFYRAEIVPFVSPERKPERPRRTTTIDAEPEQAF